MGVPRRRGARVPCASSRPARAPAAAGAVGGGRRARRGRVPAAVRAYTYDPPRACPSTSSPRARAAAREDPLRRRAPARAVHARVRARGLLPAGVHPHRRPGARRLLLRAVLLGHRVPRRGPPRRALGVRPGAPRHFREEQHRGLGAALRRDRQVVAARARAPPDRAGRAVTTATQSRRGFSPDGPARAASSAGQLTRTWAAEYPRCAARTS